MRVSTAPAAVADQVCFLDSGRVIEAGPPQRMLGQPTELGRGSSCTESSKLAA